MRLICMHEGSGSARLPQLCSYVGPRRRMRKGKGPAGFWVPKPKSRHCICLAFASANTSTSNIVTISAIVHVQRAALDMRLAFRPHPDQKARVIENIHHRPSPCEDGVGVESVLSRRQQQTPRKHQVPWSELTPR